MACEVTVELDQQSLKELVDVMDREFPSLMRTARINAHTDVADEVVALSKQFAPISPTKEQYIRTLKRAKKTKRTDFNPGGLMRSITSEVSEDGAKVYVPSNSEAGKYADFIHYNMEYNYGIGTIEKGDGAGRLFISRAIQELLNSGRLLHLVRVQLDDVLAALGVIANDNPRGA